jgi:hypothetical protein
MPEYNLRPMALTRAGGKPDPPTPPAGGTPGTATPEDARAVASIRAHLQTSLGSIEAAVRALGFGSGQPSAVERERWRRVGSLLQQAVSEIEAARDVCGRQGPGETAPPER